LTGITLANAKNTDHHRLAKSCQWHYHTQTCYKYWKGPGAPKECHFDLDEKNRRVNTTVDHETGEICLRCLDGLVNNFNSTILEAIWCNMDIKFIGSGASAKAVLYYITDYITKSQLKTHVTYAALELAVQKLGEQDPDNGDDRQQAKRLLQKCAFAMVSHQELTAQQVCSYLMDFPDHFSSHRYINVYWNSFERFINTQEPSPECYPTAAHTTMDSETCTNNDNEPMNVTTDISTDSDDMLLPDEIQIDMSSAGQLIVRSNQVTDYQCQSLALACLTLWDFMAQTEKICLHNNASIPENDCVRTDNEIDCILQNNAQK